MQSSYATELAKLLVHHDFTRHVMVRSKIGHLQLPGSLNGEAIEMLLDTGASTTVLDLAYCRSRGIPLRETSSKGGGAGGMSLSIYVLDGAKLHLGDSPIPSEGIYAIDLSHVNKGLTMKGADPIHAVVGADILLRHEAVIDYANLSLFLRLAK